MKEEKDGGRSGEIYGGVVIVIVRYTERVD